MNSNMKAFYKAVVFDGTTMHRDKAVLVSDEKILDLVAEDAIPAGAEKIDLKGNILAPAFIDIQIYGGNGKMFSHDLSVESIQATYQYCLSGGATQFLITLATNSIEVFLKGIEVVKEYWQQGGKGMPGLHLEGPYLNPAKRGAHVERFIHKPTMEEVGMLLKRGKGVIKIMTLAPEQCDASIIQLLQNNGVIISAGHSNATYEQATTAFDNGIPVATHLFNAMSPLQHRAPGLPGAIYNHPKVMSSIVPDGIHVDFAVLRISKKVMQERLFMITDAVAETTSGEYQHVFKGDRYTLPDGTLSGSALTMMKGVKNCVERAGIPLEEALRMASLYPAKAIGQSNEMGRIEKGYNAEMVVFDKEFKVAGVIN
jgi:N-acetylglucosamine-6-phosphate deacetylase